MPKKPLRAHDAAVMDAVHMSKRKPFTELRDFTDTPGALAKEIDAGNMDALCTLYKLRDGRMGMMNGGFTAEGLFATLCELRRTMIATQGLVDDDDTATVAEAKAEVRRLRVELADALIARDA